MNVCQIIVGSLPYYTQLAFGDMPNAVKGDSPLKKQPGDKDGLTMLSLYKSEMV